MAFPDYSSVFSGGGSNVVSTAFAPSTGNLAKGGGFSMDPFSIGLGVAGIGASLFGASQAQQAQADAIKAQVAGANFAAQQQVDARAMQMAQGLLGMQFGEFIAAPRELERQKEAQKFQFGELAGMQRAGRQEDWKRAMAQATSGLGKEAQRQANREQLKAALAQQIGQGRAMFGPIAPISVDQMFAG